jgi:hypothetical protein
VKNFFRQSFYLIRQIALPVFILTTLAGTLEQLLSLTLETELRNPDGGTQRIWFLVTFSIVNSLSWPWLMSLIVLYKLRPAALPTSSSIEGESPSLNSSPSWFEFFSHYGAQSFIETLRSWGKSLAYSLLLILPGIWKFLEYTFVSWIVCFDPSYERGEVDALKKSARFFRKRWFTMLMIIFLFAILLPLVLTSLFEDYRLIWQTPLPSLALHLVDTLIHLAYFQVVTLIFFRLLAKEELHGTHI